MGKRAHELCKCTDWSRALIIASFCCKDEECRDLLCGDARRSASWHRYFSVKADDARRGDAHKSTRSHCPASPPKHRYRVSGDNPINTRQDEESAAKSLVVTAKRTCVERRTQQRVLATEKEKKKNNNNNVLQSGCSSLSSAFGGSTDPPWYDTSQFTGEASIRRV